MKLIAWTVMAACLTLTACGGDDVSTTGSASSSGPSSPGGGGNTGGGNTGGGSTGGGTSQTQAGWSQAVALDGKTVAFEPSTTIDANGDTLVTWMTNGPTGAIGNEMWGARYVPGAGWSTATRLDTGDGTHAMTGPGTIQPQLVGNAAGQAVAFWTEWTPGPNMYALWARPFSPGAGWGAAYEVAPDVTSSTYTAGIDGKGNALVAFPQATSILDSRIAWTRYTPDGKWSPTTQIQMPVQTGPGAVMGDTFNVRPVISVLSSGSAVLAWGQTNHTQSAIWTATYDAANGWTNVNPAVTDTSLFTNIDTPTVGMDAKGNITLVWGQLDVANGKIMTTTMSQRYVAGTGWQAAKPVAPEITEVSGFIATPILAVSENGAAGVMWAEGGAVLKVSVADTDGNWGPLQTLSEHLNSFAGQLPPLVIDDAGNVTAAWQDMGTSGSSNIVTSSYRNGTWSATTLGQDPQSSSWPALAVNAAGAMALIWENYIEDVGQQIQTAFYTPGH
ncbi:hypothetical protein DIE11_17650 [Burkholderia sp. Bp9012]|uniref:hypothetical protein n=1 Tax=Burkholderia sp. Bp9012 TaxID=2184562 RepID=UPI000F5B3430|nr:hypothetical protein [Burkholderia sp. Bp9012]RQR79214.1 hypothetical protein DIE11_17650 [Burkholderia sp. Bp9012]